MQLNSLEDAINRRDAVDNGEFKEQLEDREGVVIQEFIVAPFSVSENERINYVNEFMASNVSVKEFAQKSKYVDFDVYYTVRFGENLSIVWLSDVFP